MSRYAEVENAPPVVRQHQKDTKDLKADRRHREKVHRHHTLHMSLQERPPSLGRRFSMSHHVLGDGGFGNLDTQFQQLTVNARAPQRGLLRLIIRIRSWTSCGTGGPPCLAAADSPRPEQAEALMMPGDNCFGLDDHQGGFPVATHAPQPDPEESVRGHQLQPFRSRRRKTVSCCRRARFSSRSWVEVLNIEARAPSAVNRCCCADRRNR